MKGGVQRKQGFPRSTFGTNGHIRPKAGEARSLVTECGRNRGEVAPQGGGVGSPVGTSAVFSASGRCVVLGERAGGERGVCLIGYLPFQGILGAGVSGLPRVTPHTNTILAVSTSNQRQHRTKRDRRNSCSTSTLGHEQSMVNNYTREAIRGGRRGGSAVRAKDPQLI